VKRLSLLTDVALAAVAFALTVAQLANGGFGSSDTVSRALDGWGLVLAAVSALPLAARRVRPLTAYLVMAAASLALIGLGYPFDVPFGVAVGTYALGLTYGGDAPRARRWLAIAAVAAFVPAIAAGYEVIGYPVQRITTELVSMMLCLAGLWIAGDRSRLRRERIISLEERAHRAEREAQRERRLAAAEERTRIARELHDSAGHAINVILVQAGAARLLHDRDPEGSRRALATVEEVARTTIGEIDRLVGVLRDDRGLEPPVPADPEAIDTLIDRHRAAGLRIDAEIQGDRGLLADSVAWAAYRILQEALTNAARHGGGSADVLVRYGGGTVDVSVTNPVSGRRRHATRGGGHGIVGMRERADLLGGTLDVVHGSDLFRLRVHLPRRPGIRPVGAAPSETSSAGEGSTGPPLSGHASAAQPVPAHHAADR